MIVSILLPTTGRPDRAERVVHQIRDTTEGHEVEIVAAVDADPETLRRLDPLVDRLTYTDELRGCSRAWNDALAMATGGYIVFAADDLVFEAGWLDEALRVMREAFGPEGGLVGFNDGHWDGHVLSTHYLMSRDFICTVLGGVVAWPQYLHSFNDLETCERAKRAGRYAWAEDAHVRHEHWLFGDRPQDETDSRRLPAHGEDERIYRERAAAGFPNEHEAVIRC